MSPDTWEPDPGYINKYNRTSFQSDKSSSQKKSVDSVELVENALQDLIDDSNQRRGKQTQYY